MQLSTYMQNCAECEEEAWTPHRVPVLGPVVMTTVLFYLQETSHLMIRALTPLVTRRSDACPYQHWICFHYNLRDKEPLPLLRRTCWTNVWGLMWTLHDTIFSSTVSNYSHEATHPCQSHLSILESSCHPSTMFGYLSPMPPWKSLCQTKWLLPHGVFPISPQGPNAELNQIYSLLSIALYLHTNGEIYNIKYS